jgi:MarR family transcriptional regulator, lower aerobic nicotinate degradation pathway regulator
MDLLRTRKKPRGQTGVAGHELARALRAAYLALHRRTNACFAADGVTADQFVLLSALSDADGVTQQDLVRRTGSDPNTVRAMLVLLEARGLVARDRHPADSRARLVTLTPEGRRLFKRLWASSEPLRGELLTAFRADQVAALVEQLRRVADVLTGAAVNARPASG